MGVYSYLERILSPTAILFQDFSLKQADFHYIYSNVINDNQVTSSVLTNSFTTSTVYMSTSY